LIARLARRRLQFSLASRERAEAESSTPAPDPLRDDPGAFIERATGKVPDAWQVRAVASTSDRMLLLTHRQAGKSTAVGGLACGTAIYRPDSLVILVSASQRQTGELFRKVVRFYKRLGSPLRAVEDSATTLALTNGSRIVSLPDSPDTIVGYSAPQLVIIDEAARTSDETFHAVTPMLLESRGRLVAMSTPFGKRGWFHEEWHKEAANWERIRFRASENPRLDNDYAREFLRQEMIIKGPRRFDQEYECEFTETDDQLFGGDVIDRAFEGGDVAEGSPSIFAGVAFDD
jgi:hypothetical protein